MIVTPDSGRLLLVTQADHARLAADVLALWRRDGLPDHPRREALLHATREHDCGWWEADAAPRVSDAGPVDFRDVSDDLRDEIWERGFRRLEESSYAALLLIEHAEAIHRGSTGPRLLKRLQTLAAGRPELLAAAGVDPRTVAADYAWLDLADAVSLCLCGAWSRVERRGWTCVAGPSGFTLEPFPLAGATTFRVPCRSIPDRPYAGDADLAGELAAARWEHRKVRLEPPLEPAVGQKPRDTLAP